MSSFVERPRTTCAQGGALVTLGSLPRVIAISHSGEGCSGNLIGALGYGGGNLGEGYCSGMQTPTSAVRESHVVFGGAERLEEQISSSLEIMDADLFVVVTGCMTEMIGDDVESVVSEFEGSETPVIAVSTPSFAGDAYSGYERVLEGIFNEFIPEADEKDPKLINIFGLVPALDPFFRGDLEEIKRLLESLGFKVNTFFTPDQTFENITSASQASLNINFSRVHGAEFVEHFERKHGTPFWITDIPIGAEASERFLRELKEHIKVDESLLETVLQKETDYYYGYFIRALDVVMNGRQFYYSSVVSNSTYAIPLANFLQKELGWLVKEIYDTDIIEDYAKDQVLAGVDANGITGELIFETNTQEIARSIAKRHPRNQGKRYFDQDGPFYIVGSALEKYAALDLQAQYLAVSYPAYNRLITTRGYAGFRGGLQLLEDLVSNAIQGR